jgi:uncharacterized protein (TIGR03790 family)
MRLDFCMAETWAAIRQALGADGGQRTAATRVLHAVLAWAGGLAASAALAAGDSSAPGPASAAVPTPPAAEASDTSQASSAASQPVPAAAASAMPARRWAPVPAIRGRLMASQLGLVLNLEDPDSLALGAHYAAARGLTESQILRVSLPRRAVLTPAEFTGLLEAVEGHFGPQIQALALAWNQPYAVACNSLTGALALGLDEALCAQSCGRSRSSGWFNSASTRPLLVPGIRPAMLLAAPTLAEARALVDRGVAADGSLLRASTAGGGDRNTPPALVLLLDGPDRARQVRRALYPPGDGGPLPWAPGVVWREAPADRALPGAERLLLAITGSLQLPLSPAPQWLPGGLGDHLTSFGGDLAGSHGQATAMAWIASGATASHGTVSEPCNHWQKFPHPQVLLGHYLQGATAIEAYWRSVAWPQQSLFIGEPLAAPFAERKPATPPGRLAVPPADRLVLPPAASAASAANAD